MFRILLYHFSNGSTIINTNLEFQGTVNFTTSSEDIANSLNDVDITVNLTDLTKKFNTGEYHTLFKMFSKNVVVASSLFQWRQLLLWNPFYRSHKLSTSCLGLLYITWKFYSKKCHAPNNLITHCLS